MPMKRELYPANWDEIALAIKCAADWKCQECGKQCRRPGEPFITHRNTLTTAHLDHNPENCDSSNLRALCAPCHLRYDAPAKARKRREKRLTSLSQFHLFAFSCVPFDEDGRSRQSEPF